MADLFFREYNMFIFLSSCLLYPTIMVIQSCKILGVHRLLIIHRDEIPQNVNFS